jgi:hypothetical protein
MLRLEYANPSIPHFVASNIAFLASSTRHPKLYTICTSILQCATCLNVAAAASASTFDLSARRSLPSLFHDDECLGKDLSARSMDACSLSRDAREARASGKKNVEAEFIDDTNDPKYASNLDQKLFLCDIIVENDKIE